MDFFYDYRPARVVQAKRWYVEFYQINPETRVMERFREYHNLNRIKDLKQRLHIASRYASELNTNKLPYGYPFVETLKKYDDLPIQEAISMALKIKSRSDRKKTGGTYRSVVNYLMEYLLKKGITEINIRQFTFRHAVDFLDHTVEEKNITARTFNNYRQLLTSLWNELIDRSYITDNPWSKVKKMKVTDKNRKMLSQTDAQIIMNEAHEHSPMLFLSILLLYYCFIRPEEQRRLKVNNIDLMSGTIYIPGEISKNKRSETVTIPEAIIPALASVGLTGWHRNDFIFGKGLRPHPTIQCGANALNEAHRKIIHHLFQENKLRSITGISLYSWKDTGAMSLVRAGIDIYEVMKQMRHTDLSTTQKYLKSLSQINKGIYQLKSIMLPT
jgi:integrase